MSKLFLRKIALSFARAFASVFVLGLLGAYDPFVKGDLAGAKAALIALLGAAGAAGLKALQVAFTTWESPPQ